MSDNIKYWKTQAAALLVFVRFLFLLVISSDFFLTLVSVSSQRGLVLTGFGAVFHPWAIALWLIVILGLSISFSGAMRHGKLDNKIFNRLAQTMLAMSIVLYTGLTILVFVNIVVAWPIALAYATNVLWAAGLMYFRHSYNQDPEEIM